MSDRERRRKGTHTSIAGDAADEVITTLVDQFSDRYTFVRELVQNSLDAGASRIEIRMEPTDDGLEIAVVDDGEGMDRATIEGYLLVKFRSTKEQDLTKIGKFGIGFVSVFAMEPVEVVVDTGRDAIWHRVQFGSDRAWTLLAMPDPFEGTTVRLRVRATSAEGRKIASRVHAAAVTWCRFAAAEITTSAAGAWTERSIRAPFEVEAAVVVREVSDGFVAVLGPHPAKQPPVGLYNRGLTLWEERSALIPGVTFRVDAHQLEHTVTRDNVIRNPSFEAVLARLRSIAGRALGDAVHDAIGAAQHDLVRLGAIYASFGPEVPWRWQEERLLFPAVGRGSVSLRELRPGLFGRAQPLLCGSPGDVLAQRVAAAGRAVLVGRVGDPHLDYLARMVGRELEPVEQVFQCPQQAPIDATARALLDAIEELLGRGVHLGRFRGPFALARQTAFEPEPIESAGPVVVISADHDLYPKLRGLPPRLGAALAVRAIEISTLPGTRLAAARVVAALDALE